jgi:predicted oxidoreductase
MSLAHSITLGHLGLRVSPFCLGAMTFGKEWGASGSEPAQATRILDRCIERGGSFIDTANGTDMLGKVPAFAFGGTTINGQESKAWAQAPQNESERF